MFHRQKRTTQYERQRCQIFTKAGWIDYSLIRSPKRRSLTINIKEEGEVHVYSPRSLKEEEIRDFILSKADWINRHVTRLKQERTKFLEKSFTDGEKFFFRGKKYPLHVHVRKEGRARILFDGTKWTIDIPSSMAPGEREDKVKQMFVKWYRTQAKELLGVRVFHYARLMDMEPLTVTVRSQKRIWGSCHSGRKTINLNWQLILSPSEVMDYVVVHEICHLFHANHGKRFWKKVQKYMPDYKKHQKWLRDHSQEIKIPE